MQRKLDWQGADPRELDFDELKEAIHEPTGDDTVEDTYRSRIRNQSTAIRAYCVVCQGGSVAGIKECPATTCVLFPFRMGKDPLRGFELPKVNEEALSDEDMTEEELDDDSEDDEDEDESGED